ncbi:hypothetical protein HXT54_01560 [Gardnerella sp. KA00603]|jgi:hypothetical protein|uniref:Uncharacterized protein n=2 Tax=Gardnerella vaginalis TaxID=2702 RepID=I4LZN4_GARVA|nr:hypothetical protein [Gardnerella vaginalis]MBF9308758.1 hypothetical protein [Bifidobacteriaceae bacterium NR043]MBF9353662.1 hypothetical protein [Bifidobacteriaceae bacterium NR044]RFT39649.1 hypothetical protein CG398_03540 [Bifidobacteriaceae bacterium NR003]RIY18366.1 hypothetical protein CJI57_01070 [Bifidobacteriaceae bacterium WP012]EIK82424.1 hypothetical protein CGSMWGv1500E_04436 [Gardnerella vaginalis 1500E]
MFKRLFWMCVGIVIGVLAVTKARAYLKAKMPDSARKFVFSKEPENITLSTILGLFKDFNESRKKHEDELNSRYAHSRHEDF